MNVTDRTSFNYFQAPPTRGRGHVGGRTGGRGHGSGKNLNKLCSYCGKIGHLVNTCYRKHGFPPHLKDSKRQEMAKINNISSEKIMKMNKKQQATRYLCMRRMVKAQMLSLLQSKRRSCSHSCNEMELNQFIVSIKL
ncbi:uncharacterized protein DS421_1g29440 [Arachis hypogaea]|nr:uncharacterized protein DS421_1g29440 [Arachis hypogaea]